MPSKPVLVIALALILAAFAFGRYTATTTKSDTKIDEVKEIDTHQHKVITDTKNKDGSETTVTVVDTEKDTTDKKDIETKVETLSKPRLNVSALVAEDIHHFGTPAYGISISKEFIGPITIGGFGLTNGTIGLSIGLNF